MRFDNLYVSSRFLVKVLASIPYFYHIPVTFFKEAREREKYKQQYLSVLNNLNDYLDDLFYDIKPALLYGFPDKCGFYYYMNDIVILICDELYIFDFFYVDIALKYKVKKILWEALHLNDELVYRMFEYLGDRIIGLDKPKMRNIMDNDGASRFAYLFYDVLYERDLRRVQYVIL